MVEDKEYYFELIRQNLGDDKRFAEDFKWIKNMVKEYSEKLGFSELELIKAFEKRRNYWSANYYQECNFPSLKDVTVFDTKEHFFKCFPSKKYRCTSCNEITADPNMCDECGWKTYGLFRCTNSFRFILKEDFLDNPIVYDIYPPIELDNKTIDQILEEVNCDRCRCN